MNKPSPRPRAVSVLKEMKLAPVGAGGALEVPRAEWAGVFISKKTTARFFGVALGTLERWRREGRGPVATKVGNRVMYAREEIALWVNAHRNLTTTFGGIKPVGSRPIAGVTGQFDDTIRNIGHAAGAAE